MTKQAENDSNSPCKACSGDVRKQFAQTFRAWREHSGLCLKAVACDLGVSEQAVHMWETGERFPSGDHLQAIIQYSAIPVCRFFGPDTQADPPSCPYLPVNNMLKTSC